jgi:hypothetical protein
MPATIGEGRALAVRYRALATILPYSGSPLQPCEIVRQRAFFANNSSAALRLPQATEPTAQTPYLGQGGDHPALGEMEGLGAGKPWRGLKLIRRGE